MKQVVLKQIVLVLGCIVLGSSLSNIISDLIILTSSQQAVISSVISSIAMFVMVKNLKN